MTCIAIDNTVWGSCYSAHQAVGRVSYSTTLIWSVVFISNACRLNVQVYRGALISHLNVSLLLSFLTEYWYKISLKSPSINIDLKNWTWKIWFLPSLLQLRTSWPAYFQMHFAVWIVFQYLYRLDSRQYPPYMWLFWSNQHTYCFRCVVYNVMRSSICATYLQACLKKLPWVQVTPYHQHNSMNLPRHPPHSTLHLLLGGDGLGRLYIHYTTMVTTVPLAWSHLNNGMSLLILLDLGDLSLEGGD